MSAGKFAIIHRGGNVKKSVGFVAVLLLICTLSVFAGAKAEQGEKQIVLGKVPYTLEHAYHQNIIKEWESYGPKTYGIKVVSIDGEASNEKTLAAVESLIAQKVDGIALHTGDASIMTRSIKLAHAANIPIITTFIRPSEKLAPHIQANETPASFEMGKIAATQWKKTFPNTPIRVAMLDFGGFEQIEELRTGPFIQGVKSVDPSAVLVAQLNGEGSATRSMEVMFDILQKDPAVNIIFGANDDMALGALAALEQVGRGKMNNGVPLTEIIASVDGSPPALVQVYKPNSSLKLNIGAVRDNARLEIDTLMNIIGGKTPMKGWTEVLVPQTLVDFWSTPIAVAQQFLEENFFYTGKLADEIKK
jgi:ABC-type sugar transport system substrate-binding protein